MRIRAEIVSSCSSDVCSWALVISRFWGALCFLVWLDIAPWTFESVSHETQELESSSSGGAEGAAYFWKIPSRSNCSRSWRRRDQTSTGNVNGVDLVRTEESKGGVEDNNSICIFRTLISVWDQRRKDVFCSKFKFYVARTIWCNLSGQFIWTTQLSFIWYGT